MSKFDEYIKNEEAKLSFLESANKDIYKYFAEFHLRNDKGEYVIQNNSFMYPYVVIALAELFQNNGINFAQINPEANRIIEECQKKISGAWTRNHWEFLKTNCNGTHLDIDTLRLLLFKESSLRSQMTMVFGSELINEQVFPKNDNTLGKLEELKEVYSILIEKRQIEEYTLEEVKQKYLEKLGLNDQLAELKKEKEQLEQIIKNGGLYTLETHPIYPTIISKISDLESKIAEIRDCTDEKKIEEYRYELIPPKAIEYERDYDKYRKVKEQEELDKQGKSTTTQYYELSREKDELRVKQGNYERNEKTVESLISKLGVISEILDSGIIVELEELDDKYAQSKNEFLRCQEEFDKGLGLEVNGNRDTAIFAKERDLDKSVEDAQQELVDYENKFIKTKKTLEEKKERLDQAKKAREAYYKAKQALSKASNYYNELHGKIHHICSEICEKLYMRGFINSRVAISYNYQSILNELTLIKERLETQIQEWKNLLEQTRERDSITSSQDYTDRMNQIIAREEELNEIGVFRREVEQNPEYFSMIDQAMDFVEDDHPRR